MRELEQACKEIKDFGVKATPLICDISNTGDIRQTVFKALTEFGRIDILVNNAAISPFVAPVEEIREDGWDKIINTNLKGCFFLTQEVGKNMIKRREGKVINIASVGGAVGLLGQAVYCISKAGMIMLTKMFALEWGKYNIHVNALGPGIFETTLTEKLRGNKGYIKDRLRGIPLNRLGKTDEMVGAALFLASDLSNYLTGQTIFINGGRLSGL